MTKEGKNAQKFAAFMSYAHADEGIAGRLHLALETYRLPKAFKGQDQHSLKPIFRDVADLTAHHSLSDKIRDAVAGSRCMIVLCSPAAKNSHWVNAEIRYFRELHGDDNIYSVMASGSPATAFPEALTEGGREPLAADISGDKAGFRLGVTQLAAALLGIGLDDLVRRDERRRTRQFQTGMLASLAFSGVMAAATFTAMDARKEAEASRNDAEGLVEYMITDLKDKLEPVGRLDILDGVGDQAVAYYDSQDTKNLTDESLARQARARHVLGQVALDANNTQIAKREIESAARLTEKVLDRNPNDTNAIFAHAQSEFWVGKIAFDGGEMPTAYKHWEHYKDMTAQLHAIDEDNFEWIIEAASGENNLGTIYLRERRHATALRHFETSLRLFGLAQAKSPTNKLVNKSMANVFAGASQASLYVATADAARTYREKQIGIYEQLTKDAQTDYWLNHKLLKAKREFIKIFEPEDRIASKQLLSRMKNLSDHDLSNARWKKTYFHQLIFELNKLYFRNNYTDFLTLKEDYDIALQRYVKLVPALNDYESLMVDLIGIQTRFISDEDGAESELNGLNSTFVSKNNDRFFGLQIDIVLMCMNEDIGDSQTSRLFAAKYLNYDWVKSDINSPVVLRRKIMAHEILNNKEDAAKLTELLQFRGFQVNTDIKRCF